MKFRTTIQPKVKLGDEIKELLESRSNIQEIYLISAFAKLRTILRLREQLLLHVNKGTKVKFLLGIDLGGTSAEVLHELAGWDCDTLINHNPITRSTFHPKAYFFRFEEQATLIVGSNNLTDGGMYTNIEAASRFDFDLPEDLDQMNKLLDPISLLLEETQNTKKLDQLLLKQIISTGLAPTEQTLRGSVKNKNHKCNPFALTYIERAPLLPITLREHEQKDKELTFKNVDNTIETHSNVIVWKKKLTKTDALQVSGNTNHVGGVRLTQARFRDTNGIIIDQTTYFRHLFSDYIWEPDTKFTNAKKEHTFVPFLVKISGKTLGIKNLEISHKPSGEAGQGNYTTILKWGPNFSNQIKELNLSGKLLCLYETSHPNTNFILEIA